MTDSNPFDHFQFAQELASSLSADGFDTWGSRIKSDIEEGSTATEILMRLRATLEKLVNEEISLQSKTMTSRLIDEITSSLGG